jgi:hypothetical protein
MALARVWNDNVHPHTERFKERDIVIPPKAFIEMDYDEAKEFRSQFTGIRTDGERNPLPTSFKMIRVERITTDAAIAADLICHATGKRASSEAELAAMNAEHEGQLEAESKKALDALADNVRLKKELDDLKAALAERVAQEKRGPGRPKKEG